MGRLTDSDLADPVDRHMRTDFARLGGAMTVGEALESMRRNPPEGRVLYLYVVDEAGRLVGVVPTRRLLLSSLERRIADIMVRDLLTVPRAATVLDACEFFTLHRLLAFPVVDQDGRIVGVIDVDLYTDELAEFGSRDSVDDLFQLIGVHLSVGQQLSPWSSFRGRFPWLLCNVAGGILAAFLTGLFEEELRRVVSLALFIPVVLALAESVSVQSVSLALQTLHGNRPTWSTLFRRARQEVTTGVLLGGACALLVGLFAGLWLGEPAVVASILGGITAGVTFAAGTGLLLPNLLRIFRFDPRVAAGPIALALADMLTLLAYFNLARWLV